jgi:uncharacterized protein DUF6677
MRRTVTPPRPGSAIPACLLAWIVPGGGHLYLRRLDKGLIFLGGIGALFLLGVGMDSRLEMSLGLDDLLASLFSLAQMAIGVPYFLARSLGFGAGDMDAVKRVTFEYGNTFTAVAGLLNILVVLDAYDTAVGRKP